MNGLYTSKPGQAKTPHFGVCRCGVHDLRMGSSQALQTERYQTFLHKLRAARKETGLTQAEVAEKLRRSQTWVSKCELGERRVDFVELEDFANAYGKQLSFFGTRRNR